MSSFPIQNIAIINYPMHTYNDTIVPAKILLQDSSSLHVYKFDFKLSENLNYVLQFNCDAPIKLRSIEGCSKILEMHAHNINGVSQCVN